MVPGPSLLPPAAIDIVAFALRIAFWSLDHTTRPVLILDEPFRNLSKGRKQEKAAEVVRMLADKLELQIVMASHVRETVAVADKEFNVWLEKGESKINETRSSRPI